MNPQPPKTDTPLVGDNSYIHIHTEFKGSYTARLGFKKCAVCLQMYTDSTDTQMTQEKTEELSPELLHDLRILGEKYYGNQLYSEHITYQHELQSLIQKHLQQREQAAEHRGYAKGYVEGSNTGVDNVRNSLLYHCAESRRKTINYSVVDRILGEMIHTPTPKEGDVAG